MRSIGDRGGGRGWQPRNRKLEESIKTRKEKKKESVLGGSSAAAIKNLFDDPSVPVASRSWKKRGMKKEEEDR